MKKLSLLFSITFILSAFVAKGQNIGINNTNPQAALDLQGDLRLRSAILTLPAGLNNDVDLVTQKSSVYMFGGGALTINACQITGFTGGVDGRVVTIFNNSTIGAIQLYDANFSISPSAAANKILTGTGNNVVIFSNGSATLRYDGAKQKWTVMSSNYTAGLDPNPSPWNTLGNNIFNTNTANIGLGVTNPNEKLDVLGSIKTTGEIKPNGTGGQTNQVLTSNGNGTMQWAAKTSDEQIPGIGSWGDCSMGNITGYNPIQVEGASNPVVAISGDYAIIGGYSNLGGTAGTARIFKRNPTVGSWEQQGATLTNQNPVPNDFFGSSVSISGDYAIVGADGDDVGGLIDNGSATIFKRNTVTNIWEQQGAKLINSNAANADNFGISVSISGDYAIVGAYGDDEGGFTNNGSATVFKRNLTTDIWEQQGVKLINANSASGDNFGYSVGISGDYVIIGAYNDSEFGYNQNGSATIFKKNTATGIWEQQGSKLINPSSASFDNFGFAVSISGDYAIIGAFSDSEGGFTNNGSATIYKRNTATGAWEQNSRKLINSNPTNGENFGRKVSMSGNYAIVGAPFDALGSVTDYGSATIFNKTGNIWRYLQKVTDPGRQTFSYFGNSCGIDSSGRFLIDAGIGGLVIFGKVR